MKYKRSSTRKALSSIVVEWSWPARKHSWRAELALIQHSSKKTVHTTHIVNWRKQCWQLSFTSSNTKTHIEMMRENRKRCEMQRGGVQMDGRIMRNCETHKKRGNKSERQRMTRAEHPHTHAAIPPKLPIQQLSPPRVFQRTNAAHHPHQIFVSCGGQAQQVTAPALARREK